MYVLGLDILPWPAAGFILGIMLAGYYKNAWDFLNPIWLAKKSKMNIIGVIFHWIIYSLLCPLATIIYWIYKLFTFEIKK
jgi:hypothetical protein